MIKKIVRVRNMCLRFKSFVLVFCFIILISLDVFANGIIAESRSFRSSDLDMPCNYEKLHKLLSMDIDELIIDEDFIIDSFGGKIDTKISRIVGEDVTFDVRTNITVKINNQVVPEVFIDAFSPIEYLGGISFDFNGHACRSAIVVRSTSRKAEITNISIKGIDIRNYPLLPQTYIIGLNIKLSDNSSVGVNDISVENMYSTANKIIGDSCGNISGIYITGKAEIISSLEVYDCHFTDLHNYDENRNIILEDTNGIYVSLLSPVHTNTKVHIHDIEGVDYGKRLIKTDCSNLMIERIYASSKYYDTLSAISLNNGDGKVHYNAVIDNVHFTGTTQYVVGSSVPDTRISNVFSDITIAPKSYTAAILPSESCFVENLELRGAQLIAGVVNTNKKVVIGHVKYDDTMYEHGLYGSSLFLTKDAHLYLSDIDVKSDKALSLFFDNYPNQMSYSTNVYAEINDLTLDLYKASNDWFLKMNGQHHIWDVSMKNSKIVFNAPIRGLIGISPSVPEANKMRLSMADVEVIYKDINTSTTIPFGMVSFGKNTELELHNVQVFNESGKSFSTNLYSLYAKNPTGAITYDMFYVDECNIDECKTGKYGLSVTGENLIWSGGDIITHTDPSSIKSLNRNHRKFIYKDSAGKKYKWNGRKWKNVR